VVISYGKLAAPGADKARTMLLVHCTPPRRLLQTQMSGTSARFLCMMLLMFSNKPRERKKMTPFLFLS
jgi:hypothetical protein